MTEPQIRTNSEDAQLIKKDKNCSINNKIPGISLVKDRQIKLPYDVWCLICSELTKICSSDSKNGLDSKQNQLWRLSLRSLSVDLDRIFTPLAYERIEMTRENHIYTLSTEMATLNSSDGALQLIKKHTKGLELTVFTSRSACKKLCKVVELVSLKYLTFHVDSIERLQASPTARTAFTMYLTKFLHKSNMCLFTTVGRHFVVEEVAFSDPYLQSKSHAYHSNTGNLSDLVANSKEHTDHLRSKGQDLDVFHVRFKAILYQNSVNFTPLIYKFRPMRTLILEYYPWSDQDAEGPYSQWNFSRLESLSLRCVDLDSILLGLTRFTMLGLKTLVVKNCINFPGPRQAQMNWKWLSYFCAILSELNTLIIHDDWSCIMDISAAFEESAEIRRLELVDDVHGGRVSVSDLKHMQKECPDLNYLRANFEIEYGSAYTGLLLGNLCELRNVTTLWLHCSSNMPGIALLNDEIPDPVLHAISLMVRKLHIYKRGLAFESIIFSVANTLPPLGWNPAPGAKVSVYELEDGNEKGQYKRCRRMFASFGENLATEEIWHVPEL